MEIKSLLWWTLCVLTISQISWASADLQGETQVQDGSSSLSADEQALGEFKDSPVYVKPYDPKVLKLSENQLEFFQSGIDENIESYQKLMDRLIEQSGHKNRYYHVASEAKKLFGDMYDSAAAWKALAEHEEPKFDSKFFLMLAKIAEKVMADSKEQWEQYKVKGRFGRSKHNVDVNQFRSRVVAALNHVRQVINTTPMGVYVKWNELKLYEDGEEPMVKGQKQDFVDELTDLTSQIRALGYNLGVSLGTNFVKLFKALANNEGWMSKNQFLGFRLPWSKRGNDDDAGHRSQ